MGNHARRNHNAPLPSGWHRAFLIYFFGNTRGIYTNQPGLAPDPYSCLAFLGLTFIDFQATGSGEEGSWAKNFRTLGEDQSWTEPFPTENEFSDEKLALIKSQSSVFDKPSELHQKKAKVRRRHSHGVSIQPDEVVEPTDEANETKPKPRRRHSDHQSSDIRSDNSRNKAEGTSTSSPRTGRRFGRRRQNMQDFNPFDTIEEPLVDSTTETTERIPKTPKRHRRQSSLNSTSSFSGRSTISEKDSLPRAPSPPRDVFLDVPITPSRKSRRVSQENSNPLPSSSYRNLSPISDYYHESLLSAPLEMSPPSSTDPSLYQAPNSYFQTPEPSHLLWSGYPTPPSLPPPPSSPPGTFSRKSTQSFLATPPSPPLQAVENVNGEFILKSVLSVSDTPAGRFYKVRWADTWESKSSLRRAMESGKYNVQETLESKYVHGKKLYLVKWGDTWEVEADVGESEPLRLFWERMAAGELNND